MTWAKRPLKLNLPRGTWGRGGHFGGGVPGLETLAAPEKEAPSTAPLPSVQEEILKLAGQDDGLQERVRHLLQVGLSPSCLLFNSWCCVCHLCLFRTVARVTRVIGITAEQPRVSFALIATITRYGCQQVGPHHGREFQACKESRGREGRRAWSHFASSSLKGVTFFSCT